MRKKLIIWLCTATLTVLPIDCQCPVRANTAEPLLEQAEELAKAGKFDAAAEIYGQALEKCNGSARLNIESADILRKQATCFARREQWSQAAKCLERAVFIYEYNDKPNVNRNRQSKLPYYYKQDYFAPMTAAVLGEYAEALSKNNQPEKATSARDLATKLQHKSEVPAGKIEEWKKLILEAAPENDGWSDKADAKFQVALQYAQKLEPESAPVVTTLWGLSNWYASRSKYADAARTCATALSLQEKLLGESNPALYDFLCNYAAVCRKAKDYSKADELYQRALAIYAAQIPDSELTGIHNSMLDMYREQGLIDKATAIKEKLVKSIETANPTSKSVADGSRQLLEMYLKTNRFDLAEQALSKAMELDKKGGRETKLSDLTGMADIKTKLQKYAEAETLYKSAIQMCQQERLADFDVCLEKYAAMLRANDRATEAEATEARARQFRIEGGRKLWHPSN
ncbi:MAG: tetratricopeptide repeat protein [Candidatus Obscuribacterales bacterium]|nr:tetratricopeptide repeat protein [Candidatus Obscuribacterales bacterium]